MFDIHCSQLYRLGPGKALDTTVGVEILPLQAETGQCALADPSGFTVFQYGGSSFLVSSGQSHEKMHIRSLDAPAYWHKDRLSAAGRFDEALDWGRRPHQ